MPAPPETDLSDPLQAARRCSRSVQTTIGWIFWDPGAVERLAAIGLPHPFGYLAARGAPLAPAGPDAVIAAFGSIAPIGVHIAFELVAQHGTTFEAAWAERDAAVLEGLAEHAPGILEPLARLGPELWPVVEALPTVGRPLYASHLRMARPEEPVLSGWHAVNCLREWRGDTHWAVVVAGLTGVEASVLHNAWLDYEDGWLPKSRGSGDADITDALGQGPRDEGRRQRRRRRAAPAHRGRHRPPDVAAVGAAGSGRLPPVRRGDGTAVRAAAATGRRDRRPELPARLADQMTSKLMPACASSRSISGSPSAVAGVQKPPGGSPPGRSSSVIADSPSIFAVLP
jgi:hypothetical protein